MKAAKLASEDGASMGREPERARIIQDRAAG